MGPGTGGSRGTPEERARVKIDAALSASGWVVQDYDALNLAAGRGVLTIA